MAYPLKLTAHGDREIVMTREFDAPRTLVFDAWTKPELLRRWLGTHNGWTMPICEIDLRVGGRYRYVWRRPADASTATPDALPRDGAGPCSDGPSMPEMGVSGVYREIKAPELIVATERFEQEWYPGEALLTHVLKEHDDRTTSMLTILYASTEARDIVLASPMQSGVEAGYNALDDVLKELAAKSTNQ